MSFLLTLGVTACGPGLKLTSSSSSEVNSNTEPTPEPSGAGETLAPSGSVFASDTFTCGANTDVTQTNSALGGTAQTYRISGAHYQCNANGRLQVSSFTGGQSSLTLETPTTNCSLGARYSGGGSNNGSASISGLTASACDMPMQGGLLFGPDLDNGTYKLMTTSGSVLWIGGSPTAGDHLRLKISGTTVELYINESLVQSVASASGINSACKYFGISIFNAMITFGDFYIQDCVP